MAYLHCHNPGCGWAQDDFWSLDKYNPITSSSMSSLAETLLKEWVYCDEWYAKAMELPYTMTERGARVDAKEYVASELERKARNIRNMDVKTWEEWNIRKENWHCPKCKEHFPDID